MKKSDFIELRIKKSTFIVALVLIACAFIWSWRGDISNILDIAMKTDRALDEADQGRTGSE